MNGMDYIEADRRVSDLERAADQQWRLTSSTGERQQYIDRALREALVEAVARADVGLPEWEDVKSQIATAARHVAGMPGAFGLDEETFTDATQDDPEKWVERAVDLLDALAERIGELQEKIAESAAGVEADVRPVATEPKRPKNRTGATTVGLFNMMPAANDVTAGEPKPKRGQKAAAK